MRAPPHPPKRKRVAMRRVTDGEEGGRERRHTGEEGGTAAPLASHPLQEGLACSLSPGPAAEIPALHAAQLACCQSCASSRLGSGKWGTRRAYGREARKRRAKGWTSAWPRDAEPGGCSQPRPLRSTELEDPSLRKHPGSAQGRDLGLGTQGTREIMRSGWYKQVSRPH